MAFVVDKNSEEYYSYIETGKELWYENPNANSKSADICAKVPPYNKSFVASKDIQRRRVKFRDGNSCDFSRTLQVINSDAINVCDMANTKDINEVDLLLNLKNRYLGNQGKTEIFTNVGNTLLIVNPFKTLQGVYGAQVIDYFLKAHEAIKPDQRQEITESHLYDAVLIAIRDLLKSNSLNQVLIISGESGAGKTEAAKDAMKCITYYFSTKFSSNASNSLLSLADCLGDQILNCNPILEAFGNAKTIRNDNSSRFGKYVKIKLNAKSFSIEGAKIKTYLLEKSRISDLSIAERNYHIFYMLLKGATDSELKQYHLIRNINAYSYLYKGPQQVIAVERINDSELFQNLITCFKSTGFTSKETGMVFRLLAVVLHLGNVKIIKKSEEEVEVITQEDFQYAVELLEVDYGLFLNNLTRKPPNKHMKEWGSIYEDRTIKQYIDSLAKDLYNKLFQWIVAKLNHQFNKKANEKQRYIGLLDIFGFECLNSNSLEQFCINYTNEKLQQLYIKDIFESDKEEFRKEGLENKINLLDATFKDNKNVIKCMEAFFYLTKSDATDERVYTTASKFAKEIDKSDRDRLEKIRSITQNCIFTEKINKEKFKLSHSAREVTYTTKGWAEKNIDEMKDSMLDCLMSSNNPIVQMIWTSTTNMTEHENQKKAIYAERQEGSLLKELRKYLGPKFQMDMDNLMKSLEKCAHHYIRCIKPNEDKAPLVFWDNFVYNQIQYLGILGTIQVRKAGFPVRRKYKDFYEAFQLVHKRKKDKIAIDDYMEITSHIITDLIGRAFDYENNCLFGRTKLYMKQVFSIALGKAKDKRLKKKCEALLMIKVSLIKKKKMMKQHLITRAIVSFQEQYRTKEKQMRSQRKKANIALIQSAFLTKKAVEHYKTSIQNILFIQNSFKIVLARKKILHKNYLSNLISVRQLMHSKHLKEKVKAKMQSVTNQLMALVTKRILEREYTALWEKVNPFIIAALVRRKYKTIATQAKLKSTVFMKEFILSVFRSRLLTRKMHERKVKAKTIFSFSSTSVISNYYYNLIHNVTVIQKYIKRGINRNEAIEKAFTSLANEEESELIQVYNRTNEILFNNKGHCYVRGIRNALHSTYLTERNLITATDNQGSSTNRFLSPPKKEVVTYTESLTKRCNEGTNGKLLFLSPSKPSKEEKKDGTSYAPTVRAYEKKITVFAKIVSIDIISSERKCYEELWASEFEKVFNVNMMNNRPIQLIYAGNCHSFVINSKRRVFSWGWNQHGQCGIHPQSSYRPCITPEPINGSMHSLPVNSYVSSGMPIRLDDIALTKKIVVGDDYALSLTNEGIVRFFGDDSRWQSDSYQLLPSVISKKGIVDVFSNETLNGVLTKSNELFVLFRSSIANSSKFNQLFIEKNTIISQISCGKGFMIALSKNGLVYGCGSNTHGELGIAKDNKLRYTSLQEIASLSKHHDRIIQVRCGFKHAVCVSSTGVAYAWGNNSYGQLGNGTKSGGSIEKIMLKSDKRLEEKVRIIQAAAGFRASMFMTDKREFYYCGVVDACHYSLSPVRIEMKPKLGEYGNQNEYAPVRILATWNRSFSLFYVSMADIRQIALNARSISKVTPILNALSEKWLDENVTAPYIPHIAHHFSSSFMEK